MFSCCERNKLLKFQKDDIPLFNFEDNKCLAKIVDIYE